MLERDLYRDYLRPWLAEKRFCCCNGPNLVNITRVESLSVPDIFVSVPNRHEAFFIEMKCATRRIDPGSMEIPIGWRPGQWAWIQENSIRVELCLWLQREDGTEEIRHYNHARKTPRLDDPRNLYIKLPLRNGKEAGHYWESNLHLDDPACIPVFDDKEE